MIISYFLYHIPYICMAVSRMVCNCANSAMLLHWHTHTQPFNITTSDMPIHVSSKYYHFILGYTAKISGLTLNFKILFYRDPKPLQMLKILWKNFCPFLRKNFAKIKIFWSYGNFPLPKFQKKIQWLPPYAWSKFGRARFIATYLFGWKTVSLFAPSGMVLYA